MDRGIVKRQLSNFLLQPLLQSKIGLYCIIISLIFCGSLAAILYININQLYAFVVDLTDAPDELEKVISTYLADVQTWLYVSVGIYILVVVALSIWYTHRLVGPMVAFKKHFEALEEGNFEHRTILRKKDAFHDAANKLNEATASLAKRFQG